MELTKSEINTLFFLNCTDAGNAERIAKMIGQDWRYCWQLKCWLHWNGKKWEKVSELALIKPIVTCFRQLSAITFSDEEKKQNPAIDAIKKFLLSSENIHRVNGCIRHLQSELVADIETFDATENLLNLQDCTLDLETGIARSHRREDFITQIAPTMYCKSYNAGLWLKTIAEILPDTDTRRYFQKFCGYCLSGSTESEKFIVLYGSGGGGKGTVMETIAAALGKDYTVTLSVNALLAGQRTADGSAHNSEIAKLKGKRLVLSSETSKGCKFDDAKIKLLTGSDTVTARMPHGLPFDYKPQFKLSIQTNFLPAIEDIFDKGMKRRLVIIPFDSKINIRNERLKKELTQSAELDAVMQWLLEGWQLYRAEGLPDYDSPDFPAEMKAVMQDFYQQQDTLSDFIAECFYTEKDAVPIKASVVFGIYQEWAKGDKSSLGRNSFYREMSKRGYPKQHTENGDYISGLLAR